MRVELWMRDEYGQGTIIASSPSVEAPLAKLKTHLYERNVDNALTAAEKEHSWESYYIQIMDNDKPSKTKHYAGNHSDGKHRVYVKNGDKFDLKSLDGEKFKVFLGVVDGKDWYLKDEKGRFVTDIKNDILTNRESLFLKIS